VPKIAATTLSDWISNGFGSLVAVPTLSVGSAGESANIASNGEANALVTTEQQDPSSHHALGGRIALKRLAASCSSRSCS